MPTSHDLKGLMKFLEREEWSSCFREVFSDHFGPILDEGGITFEDLADILGVDLTMTLWGCAFEDFLTRDFDVKGVNIVDEYLRRRGWKEGAQAKAYKKGLRSSIMSLYEVSEVVPGQSFIARDMIRGGDPVVVSEGSATKSLRQWDRVAARIVPVMNKNILAGGLLPFSSKATDALFDGLRHAFGKKNAKKLPVIKDADLQAVAALFTLSWLFDALESTIDPPSVQNADGDDLLFHDVRFPLAPGVAQKDIVPLLNGIPGMAQENAKFWNWLELESKDGTLKRNSPFIDTMMDSGVRVLGNVELKGKFLLLSVNSAERAREGTTLIRQALGDLVRAPLSEIRTLQQASAEQQARDDEPSQSEIPPEVAEQIIHEYLERHYRDTLDQPLAVLGNKSPRQAVKTAAGRHKVADWLKLIENGSARKLAPGDPMATYSFEWMWHELGIIDLRR